MGALVPKVETAFCCEALPSVRRRRPTARNFYEEDLQLLMPACGPPLWETMRLLISARQVTGTLCVPPVYCGTRLLFMGRRPVPNSPWLQLLCIDDFLSMGMIAP